MANFPLNNFHDINERTWREVLSGIDTAISHVEDEIPDVTELQSKTLSAPITIGVTECTTVEAALTAIAAALAG